MKALFWICVLLLLASLYASATEKFLLLWIVYPLFNWCVVLWCDLRDRAHNHTQIS